MANGLARLYGFLFKDPERDKQAQLPSFAPPPADDGAIQIQTSAGGAFGAFVDLEGAAKTEAELVTRYRQMASAMPEVVEAVTQVVNDAIVDDDEQDVVALDLDHLEDELPDAVRERLKQEFDRVLDLLKFKTHPYETFRTWYVDGRMYYHVIIDRDRPKDGIQELRYLDPRNVRRVREVSVAKAGPNGAETYRVVNEYFVYNDRGFGQKPGQVAGATTTVTGIKIARDSIVHATSGLLDETGKVVLGPLHSAIKYVNQLRAIEDAVLIYRLVRAPERRVWEIDVGNLPKSKADAHIRDVMTRHKNRIVYDSATGNIRDDRKYMTIWDDFYLARRPDGSGNKVSVLQGGDLAGRMDDVEYFLKRVYKSLGVPIGRLMPEDMYTVGRSSEITREELSFSRQIVRLRRRFAEGVLAECLGRQLVLIGVVSPDEWRALKLKLKFKWARDNFSAELTEREIMLGRLDLVDRMMPYIGRFFSNQQVRRDVLMQDEDAEREIDEQIEQEADDPQYAPLDSGGPDIPGEMPPPPGAGEEEPGEMPPPPKPPATGSKGPKKG